MMTMMTMTFVVRESLMSDNADEFPSHIILSDLEDSILHPKEHQAHKNANENAGDENVSVMQDSAAQPLKRSYAFAIADENDSSASSSGSQSRMTASSVRVVRDMTVRPLIHEPLPHHPNETTRQRCGPDTIYGASAATPCIPSHRESLWGPFPDRATPEEDSQEQIAPTKKVRLMSAEALQKITLSIDGVDDSW